MLAFSRITSILFFVPSLSFLTCALPTSAPQTNALAARGTGADLLKICVNLEADVKAKVDAIVIANVKVLADVEPVLLDIVALVDVAAKDVAVHIAAVIRLVVNLCLALVVKLGVTALLALLVKIDVCLQLLLVNLSVVVEGIIVLVAKLVVDLTVKVFVNLNLNLCLSVLGLINISL